MSTELQELEKSGQVSVGNARKAREEIEKGNNGAAKEPCAKAEKGAEKHMESIAKLIVRYQVMEEHYKQQEKKLTADINNVLAKQQSVQGEIDAARVRLDSERSELSRYTSDMSSDQQHLNDGRRRKKKAKRLRRHTLGLFHNKKVRKAKAEVRRCENAVARAKQRISESEGRIQSLSTTISQLDSDRLSLETQRSYLQEEKGKMKTVIVFLLDAQNYGKEFLTTTESCVERTALVGDLVRKAEARSYTLYDLKGTKRVLATFEEAWATFAEMNEKGSNYIFKIDFQCTRCNSSYREFPYVKNGQLICSSCHT